MRNRLKVLRAEKNITQEQLANLTDVSRQTINAIETNKFVPSTLIALKIASVLGKRVEEIFFLEESDLNKKPV